MRSWLNLAPRPPYTTVCGGHLATPPPPASRDGHVTKSNTLPGPNAPGAFWTSFMILQKLVPDCPRGPLNHLPRDSFSADAMICPRGNSLSPTWRTKIIRPDHLLSPDSAR